MNIEFIDNGITVGLMVIVIVIIALYIAFSDYRKK